MEKETFKNVKAFHRIKQLSADCVKWSFPSTTTTTVVHKQF